MIWRTAKETGIEFCDPAGSAGVAAVECHYPFELDFAEVRARLDASGLPMNGINTPSGDPAKGEFGFAAVPGCENDFRRGFDLALDWGARLGVATIHCMCGVPSEARRGEARETFLRNMEWASDAAKNLGIVLLVEPINHHDRPGWFVSRSDDVVALLKTLGRDNVRLMFDFYHIQIMEGDLTRRLERHWDWIGHFQFASVPRRAEPDEGEINYAPLFAEIARRGWPGWVAAEYRPRGATAEGLRWMGTLVPT